MRTCALSALQYPTGANPFAPGRIHRSGSADGGASWCPAYPTALPNNNSGLDLVRHAAHGELVLACNPVAGNWAKRTPLCLPRSADNGATWRAGPGPVPMPESGVGEFSCPAIIAADAVLHVAYTADRAAIVHREIAVSFGGAG